MIVLLKTMSPLKQICCFLVILNGQLTFGQNPNSKVSIELSIPHSGGLARIKSCLSEPDVFVIIHNGTDSVNYFYEDWNSYGYYNISFEIRFKDSIYEVRRPEKLWYRNFPSYYIVKPQEFLVLPHLLIDTACSNSLSHHQIFEDGWVGFPVKSKADTVEIRVVYQLCDPEEMIAEDGIRLLNYKRDEYVNYLDGDIESEIFYTEKEKPKQKAEEPIKPAPKLPRPKPIIIFNEPIVSEWQKVIL